MTDHHATTGNMYCLGPIHLLNHPSVMGIINVTPDSFSGDGILYGDYVSLAVERAEQMSAEGADILDIGGESSRPGSTPISVEEELRRVIPAIAAINKKLGSMPISVDTCKAEVAEQALCAGTTIVNDITALEGDARMGEVVARYGATVVLMHNKAEQDAVIRDQFKAVEYGDVVADVAQALKVRVDVALAAGIERDKIILDPGIGFGKTLQQNLALITQLGRIKALGFPVLVGLSRKSFIGKVMSGDTLEGTAAGVTVSVMQGVDMVRVHDVKFMARIVKMAAALKDAVGQV
jgi:dihydropteroate synthase